MKLYEHRIKPEVRDKSYLPALKNEGTVSEDKIISYTSLRNLVLGLGQRACYTDSLKPYCFSGDFVIVVTSK